MGYEPKDVDVSSNKAPENRTFFVSFLLVISIALF